MRRAARRRERAAYVTRLLATEPELRKDAIPARDGDRNVCPWCRSPVWKESERTDAGWQMRFRCQAVNVYELPKKEGGGTKTAPCGWESVWMSINASEVL